MMNESVLSGIIIGESVAIRRLRSLIVKIAPASGSVLIEGPTGSGKELVAEALHTLSGRTGRFVPFNVCAIADSMFEDALFGHVRGAFTGALAESPGLLGEADQGTVFLDEIAALSPPVQVKLLRALETRRFRAVGASRDRSSAFRVVAASNQSLRDAIRAGAFRADLFERLSTFVLQVPPLSERLTDIEMLVAHLERSIQGGTGAVRFTASAMAALQSYDWPGNVRELKNVVERTIVLASGAVVDRGAVMDALEPHEVRSVPPEAERAQVALDEAEWDTARAARILGVHRATVYDWIKRWRLGPRPGFERRRPTPSPAPAESHDSAEYGLYSGETGRPRNE
jgi:DNA-binding NtrC family response regulator